MLQKVQSKIRQKQLATWLQNKLAEQITKATAKSSWEELSK